MLAESPNYYIATIANNNSMKERKKTLPPKLKRVSDGITDAMKEAKKIQELSVQEEVVAELDKVNASLEQAKKEITRIMRT